MEWEQRIFCEGHVHPSADFRAERAFIQPPGACVHPQLLRQWSEGRVITCCTWEHLKRRFEFLGLCLARPHNRNAPQCLGWAQEGSRQTSRYSGIFVLHASSLRSRSCSPYRKTNLWCHLTWRNTSPGKGRYALMASLEPLKKITQLLSNFSSRNPPAWNLGTSQAPSDFGGMNYLTPSEQGKKKHVHLVFLGHSEITAGFLSSLPAMGNFKAE